jgi:FkbM family methyltransferase
MYGECLRSKIKLLKEGVNEESSNVLDYLYDCLYNAMFWTFPSKNAVMPFRQYERKTAWMEEIEEVKRKCRECGIKGIFPEVLYFHHGLRFANKNIQKYIATKDILDCGAYVGDSLLVLRQYTSGTIYSFEFSQKTIATFRKVMEINNVTSGYVLIESAIGECVSKAAITDTGKHNSSLFCVGGNTIDVTTIDEEVKNRKIKVGFIKADLEGYGFKMIKGAINTLKSQRPVLSVGIYHNYEELFELKPFLQKELKDYEFEFQLHRFSEGKFVELTLFCYPKELVI